MNVAIITARKGSKAILNKNVYLVNGRPLVYYPIKAAQDALLIDEVYISTDGEEIADVGRENGVKVIDRPEALAGDSINHGDVIDHAVQHVKAQHANLENVVVLLGNTVYIDGVLIDQCLEKLDSDENIDSVMTVWEAQDDHPLRALEKNDDGFLQPFGGGDRNVSTERQSYQTAYYYDQGVWAFRKHTIDQKDGPNPWWWMGKKSVPIIRNWVTGRDVHTHLDIEFSEFWLNNLK